MAEEQKPTQVEKTLEEQIHEKLCQRLLTALDQSSAKFNPTAAKLLAETYVLLFGQYPDLEYVDPAQTGRGTKSKNFRINKS